MRTFTHLAFIFLLLFMVRFDANGDSSHNGFANSGGKGNKGGGDFINPAVGNEYREIRDLQVWGAVGEIPFEWIRYSNSRTGTYNHLFGKAHNWNHSFQYDMIDNGSNAQGQAQILIHFPGGEEITFTQDSMDNALWLPPPMVGQRLFQNGNIYTLQMDNGHRYQFRKQINPSGGGSYQLQNIRDSKQNLYKLAYNTDKLLSRITEPAGRYLDITYGTINGTSVITQVTSNDDRKVIYSYAVFDDGATTWVELTTVTYGDGPQATYTYSQTIPGKAPLLEHAIDPRYEGAQTNIIFTYSDEVAGFIKQEINGINGEIMATLQDGVVNRVICYPNGRLQTFTYPTSLLGNIKTYSDGLGRTTNYTYDQNGLGFIKTQTDALNHMTTYDERTIYGSVLSMTFPDGSKQQWTRDDLDQILTFTDELGRLTTYTRDTNHLITQIVYPDGTSESYTYNSFGEVLKHTRRNGGIETNVYDNRGLRTSFKDAVGNITTYTYDSADRLASITNALGNTTSYEYNERGLLIEVTNADGSVKSYAYDAFGNRIVTTDELGHTWASTYDEFRRVLTTTDPLNRTTQYEYDTIEWQNKLLKIILPSGKVTEIDYDVEWQKIQECVGAGIVDEACTFYEYDQAGNLVTTVDPRGNSWVNEYDSRNRKKSANDPLGNKTQWTYNKAGNITMVERPNSGTTVYQYDKMNRLVKTTDPKGLVTKLKYDAEGNMIKLTDPKNNSYTFNYDLLNRRILIHYPCGPSESYSYDQVSNLHSYTNRSGAVRTYAYDNRNREILSDWSDNTPDIYRTYDPASRVLTINSSVSALTYTYDDANELLGETQNIAGGPGAKTVSYSYTADGLRNDMTNPSGSVVSYSYTGRNQVSSISVNGEPSLVTYTYDLNGNRISKVLENGTSTDYTYDDANRNLSIDHQNSSGSFARFEYGYDNVSRRAFVKRDNDKGDVFSYDAIDQVTDVQYEVTNPETNPTNPVRTVNYGLDPAGNRTTVTDNGVTTNYTTNNCNQYSQVGTITPTYNPNGDLKTFDGWTYTYDAQNRLIKAKQGSTVVNFSYDPRNRCVNRIINGTSTFFYYDGWTLIEERNIAGTVLTQYVNGTMIDEILAKITSGNTVYYHHDAIENVIQLTDLSGNVVEKYSYDVFGAPTIKNGSGNIITSSSFGNRFMFTGREFIKEVSLYNYRNRMYSAALGRFLQTDPIGFIGGDYNLYRYVFNNAVNLNDPLGLSSKESEKKTIDPKELEEALKKMAQSVALLELFKAALLAEFPLLEIGAIVVKEIGIDILIDIATSHLPEEGPPLPQKEPPVYTDPISLLPPEIRVDIDPVELLKEQLEQPPEIRFDIDPVELLKQQIDQGTQ